MKYENYKQVKELVEDIQKYEENLSALNDQNLLVLITYGSGSRIYTIGSGSMCEHDYAKQAAFFVGQIKEDIQKRITKLKETLDQL